MHFPSEASHAQTLSQRQPHSNITFEIMNLLLDAFSDIILRQFHSYISAFYEICHDHVFLLLLFGRSSAFF